MEKAVYLEINDEVISVVQKVKRSGSAEVVLVIPKSAKIFSNLTNLKLVREQSARLGKRISVATADEKGRMLARRAGISLTMLRAVGPDVSGVRKRVRMSNAAVDLKHDDKNKKKPEPQPVAEPAPSITSEHELSELIGPEMSDENITLPKPVHIPLSRYKNAFISAVIILVALSIVFLYVLPTASITVTPRVEALSRDLEILVDSQAATPDITTLTIPGEMVEEEFTSEQTYPVTGTKRVGEKASGFVTLYNFSNNSLILRSGTTRLEADGQTFYFLQDVGSLRPTLRSGSNFEVDPSSLTDPVPIVAADAGTDFNLPEGTRFEIHNEVFGHQPEILYAVNANPISGGTDEEVKVVSEEDIANARKGLVSEFQKQLSEKLALRPQESLVLADNAISVDVLEETFSHPIGAEAQELTIFEKARVKSLVYNEDYARDLIMERIVRLLPDNKELLPSNQSLSTEYISLDLDSGAGTLQVHFNSEIGFNLDKEVLSRGLSGKTENEVKEILLARPEVSGVSVNLSPFWVKKVPRFESKVNLKTAD